MTPAPYVSLPTPPMRRGGLPRYGKSGIGLRNWRLLRSSNLHPSIRGRFPARGSCGRNSKATALYGTRTLVVCGNLQTEETYSETFAPTASLNTFRILVALGNFFQWSLRHLDVMTAFLHGHLEEEVYMRTPPGCDTLGFLSNIRNRVLKLRKSLYGLPALDRTSHSLPHAYPSS